MRLTKGALTALICSLTLLAVCLTSVLSDRRQEPTGENRAYYRPQDFVAPIPTNSPPTPTPKPNRVTLYNKYVLHGCYLDEVRVTTVRLELEPLGWYYITAYSPQETGSWHTASGIELHRADYKHRYTEPTTCAVDRQLHHIGYEGDLFYLPDFDRVYRAEDTGSAVVGKHLDLGYTDLESVYSFPTGYYYIYRVTAIIETTEEACKYDITPYILKRLDSRL